MRVGVDATSWVNRRGYGRFARNVVRRMVELDSRTTYVLYIDEQSADAADLPAGAEQRVIRLRRSPTEAAAADSARSPLDLLRLTRAVWRDRLDAFLFPSLYTYFPVIGVPVVLGIHDAIAERSPELTLPTRRARLLFRAKRELALRGAERVFTVSTASRQALAETLGLDPELLTVVPEAPDPVFFRRERDEVAAALRSIGVEPEGRVFVYAAGVSPHKNVESLIDAYAALRARGNGDAPVLVIAGDLDGDPFLSSAGSVRERIARLGLAEHVRLPGFVPDELLAGLYSGARAAVVPSLAEGFGLPAVEAAACGAPVVLSDLPAHRESVGESALYFPATDVDALAGHLESLWRDPDMAARLGERARGAVERLSWDASAERLGEVIRGVARPAEGAPGA